MPTRLTRKPQPSAHELRAALEKGRVARDARAVKLADAITTALDTRARMVHRLGSALSELRSERLYANLGVVSFEALLERIGIGRSQAWKWMKIASALSEDEAAPLGIEQAYERATSKRRQRRGA